MMAVRDIYNPYLNLVVVSASVHDLLTASDSDYHKSRVCSYGSKIYSENLHKTAAQQQKYIRQ